MSRYEIVITFDADSDYYENNISSTLEGMFAVLPYMVDNVDIDYFVLGDMDEFLGEDDDESEG